MFDDVYVQLKLRPHELEAIQAAAHLTGMDENNFMRACLFLNACKFITPSSFSEETVTQELEFYRTMINSES